MIQKAVEGEHLKITVKKELEKYLAPLTPVELEQLHCSLEASGQAEDALIVWKTDDELILVDGHNRYKHCKKLELGFSVILKQFSSMDEVKDFIVLNQLGRRNIPPKAAAALRGNMYINRKRSKAESGQLGGIQKAKNLADKSDVCSNRQNEFLDKKTAKAIGDETGVSARTVERDAKFAEAVDELGILPGIIRGDEKRTKKEIIETANEKKTGIKTEKKERKKQSPGERVINAFARLKHSEKKKAIELIDQIWNDQ